MSCTGFSDKLCSFENSPLALLTSLSLNVLDPSNNDITDKSIAIIQHFMNNVEYLSLSGNRISSDGGKKVIAKAEELLKTADADEQSSCHLKRIWLGGNDIAGSVLAECTCKIISSELLTISNIIPNGVPGMFSSFPIDNCVEQLLSSLTPGKEVLLPIMGIMQNLLQSQVFTDVMDSAICAHNAAYFNRWFMRGVHALVHHNDCVNVVKGAYSLLNLFVFLERWFKMTKEYTLRLAVLCCMICVIDELMLTNGIHELEPAAKSTLQLITEIVH